MVRFCRAVGLRGYPELRLALAAAVAHGDASAVAAVSHGINPGDYAALIAEKGFESLDGPVVRVATPDVPIPFPPPLEQAVLPGVDRLREACRELLAY